LSVYEKKKMKHSKFILAANAIDCVTLASVAFAVSGKNYKEVTSKSELNSYRLS